jgi:phosphopentomutase
VKRRFVILVLDGTGIGALPDAADYGDAGSDTLGHVAEAVGGLRLPALEKLGLGRIGPIRGVAANAPALGAFGKMAEASKGKDTSTGHWEMMGARLDVPLAVYPNGFPPAIVEPWLGAIGRPRALGNLAASGTAIIEQLGPEHERSGDPILYTSADSVFQVACHEEVVPLPKLYAWCEAARRILDPYNVARVIARPFVGRAGHYQRTYNRRDFSIEAPPDLALDLLARAGVRTIGVGKIPDIFDGRGISEGVHTEGNADGMRRTAQLLGALDEGFLFVNLVDTDMLYGHRNDAPGFGRALVEFDAALGPILAQLGPHDLLAITADHGCDPTMPSTDHSREYVPLLLAGNQAAGRDLGTRRTFADLGQTVVEFFGVGERLANGTSLFPSLGGDVI